MQAPGPHPCRAFVSQGATSLTHVALRLMQTVVSQAKGSQHAAHMVCLSVMPPPSSNMLTGCNPAPYPQIWCTAPPACKRWRCCRQHPAKHATPTRQLLRWQHSQHKPIKKTEGERKQESERGGACAHLLLYIWPTPRCKVISLAQNFNQPWCAGTQVPRSHHSASNTSNSTSTDTVTVFSTLGGVRLKQTPGSDQQ